MNIETLRAALASGLFACAGFAHAAPAAVNQQWEVASVRVGFHSSVSSCISSAIGANNAWNAVGADLYLPTGQLAGKMTSAAALQRGFHGVASEKMRRICH